jgi:NAD(P)-dependent dehydrogenase (short-subunit alcohol dehydrogenase family)
MPFTLPPLLLLLFLLLHHCHLPKTHAAVITASPQLTEDGLDEMYQVGHVAQLLLTNLLLPALSAAPSGGRIVWVGSQLAESTPPRLAADPELFHRLHGRCGDSEGLSAAAAAAGGSGGQQQQQQQQQHLTSSAAASAPSASSAAVAMQPPPRPMDLYRLVKLYNAWAVAHMTRASILPGGASIPAAGCSAGGVVVANLVSPGFVPATGVKEMVVVMVVGLVVVMRLKPVAQRHSTAQHSTAQHSSHQRTSRLLLAWQLASSARLQCVLRKYTVFDRGHAAALQACRVTWEECSGVWPCVI